MPKTTNRTEVINSAFFNASIELASIDSSDEEEEAIHDNLIDDMMIDDRSPLTPRLLPPTGNAESVVAWSL